MLMRTESCRPIIDEKAAYVMLDIGLGQDSHVLFLSF